MKSLAGMSHARVGWRRVEAGLVRDTNALGLGHRIVGFENHAFGSVLAVLFLFPALHDGESVDHVEGRLSIDTEQMKESRIQLAPEQKAPVAVPSERFAVEAGVAGELAQVI